jgi:hypothetical protein
MKKSGVSTAVGLMGIGVTLSLHLAACSGARPTTTGSEGFVLGKQGSLNGSPLPPIQFKYEEMGDFPPVGIAKIPFMIELRQNPSLPPIEFEIEEMGDFSPVGTPRLPLKIEIKRE